MSEDTAIWAAPIAVEQGACYGFGRVDVLAFGAIHPDFGWASIFREAGAQQVRAILVGCKAVPGLAAIGSGLVLSFLHIDSGEAIIAWGTVKAVRFGGSVDSSKVFVQEDAVEEELVKAIWGNSVSVAI